MVFSSYFVGELAWLDKNRFSISFDIFTTGRSLREKEKNRRRAIIVGGTKLPWFSIETISHYNNDNNNSNNIDNYYNNDQNELNICCQPYNNKNNKYNLNNNNNYNNIYHNNNRKKESACVPIIKINNSFEKEKNDKKTRLKIMKENSYSESESLRISFNHIGIHYDCYEASGCLGKKFFSTT